MPAIVVMYHREARFDEEHYFAKHIPLLKERQSALLEDVKVLRASDDQALYRIVTVLTYKSEADMAASQNPEYSADLVADGPNFTDRPPVFQVMTAA